MSQFLTDYCYWYNSKNAKIKYKYKISYIPLGTISEDIWWVVGHVSYISLYCKKGFWTHGTPDLYKFSMGLYCNSIYIFHVSCQSTERGQLEQINQRLWRSASTKSRFFEKYGRRDFETSLRIRHFKKSEIDMQSDTSKSPKGGLEAIHTVKILTCP